MLYEHQKGYGAKLLRIRLNIILNFKVCYAHN